VVGGGRILVGWLCATTTEQPIGSPGKIQIASCA